MLESPEPISSATPLDQAYTPVNRTTPPVEQGHIARSLVIKGQISGAESLFIDGCVEGTIHFPDNRVTIGRNGSVAANIVAKEVIIMGNLQGNVDCAERLDIRSEGVLSGDVVTQRICVEEGAILKGRVEVHNARKKNQKTPTQASKQIEESEANSDTAVHAMAASAGKA
jgi:cytoskeletal protein CcmA (bactofilin family)